MANVLERTVAAGTDDAEERATGRMALHSTDLDLFNDRYGSGGIGQQVGIRFTGIDIPPGAVITSAYLQFHTDEKGSTDTSMLIRGEDADDAAGFLDVDHNISSRQATEASATWTPEPWTDLGESTGAQSTPDLSSIVQEIVARPGWESGNDLAFIISGSGSRTAEASEGVPGRAPQLHIEWVAGDAPPSGGTDKTAPTVVMEGPEDGSQVAGVITLSADASDNVGVTGVQFFLDGNSVGALDTSEPYGVKVDTTKFSDGTVALLAVATDAAGNTTTSAPVTVTIDNGGSEPPPPPPPASGTIRVPQDYATIQKAVDAAGDGDTIVVGPGTYSGGIVISGKSITLISLYQATGDPSLVDDTIIKGGSPGIRVDESAPNTTIAGFHFMGGEDAVQFYAQGGRCLDNFFDHTVNDAISFEDVGGLARGNRIVGAGDDGIDVDAASANVLIENNTISEAGDDGIEIRNQNYHGALVTHTIRGNTITGSEEDGIQLIDYSQLSDRAFVIQDNVIRGSADVGLGIMDNGETREDFRGASMPERVTVSNNTFDGNRYGITGGDNLTATGNTISNSEVGLKNVDGQSTVTGTRFINNDVNSIHSNVVGSASATSAENLALNDLVDVPDDSGMLTVSAPAGGQQGAGGSSTTTIGLNPSSQIEQPVDAASPASP
jgi:parallel beta-helix repeat protein